MSKPILVLVAYLLFAPLTYAATLAHFQGAYPSIAAKDCRTDLGFASLFALVPVSWILVPFLSGFWEYGLQWSCHSAGANDGT